MVNRGLLGILVLLLLPMIAAGPYSFNLYPDALINGGGNVSTFLQLTDTPISYGGNASNCIKVNVGETALVFGSCGTGGGAANFTNVAFINESNTFIEDQIIEGDLTAENLFGNITYNYSIVQHLTGSTYTNLEDYINKIGSTGWISGGSITSNPDLTINISAGTGMLKAVNDFSEQTLYFINYPAVTNFALDNGTNFLFVNWSGGSPQIIKLSADPGQAQDSFMIGRVVKNSVLHSTHSVRRQISDFSAHVLRRWRNTEPFEHASGIIISSTSLNLSSTQGQLWEGVVPVTISAFSMDSGDFIEYWVPVNGNFTEFHNYTSLNNTHYNNGTDAEELTTNRYAVNWIYVLADGTYNYLLGEGNYKLTQAQDSNPPASPPQSIIDIGVLVGKIIYQKGDTTPTSVQSAFQDIFTPSIATLHNNLGNLDYANAGHTGFRSSTNNTFIGNAEFFNDVTIFGDLYPQTDVYMGGGAIDMGTGQIVDLADPISGQDAMTLDYADSNYYEAINPVSNMTGTDCATGGGEFSIGFDAQGIIVCESVPIPALNNIWETMSDSLGGSVAAFGANDIFNFDEGNGITARILGSGLQINLSGNYTGNFTPTGLNVIGDYARIPGQRFPLTLTNDTNYTNSDERVLEVTINGVVAGYAKNDVEQIYIEIWNGTDSIEVDRGGISLYDGAGAALASLLAEPVQLNFKVLPGENYTIKFVHTNAIPGAGPAINYAWGYY